MISGVPLFRGRDNQDQLLHIMRIIGTPDDRVLRKIATDSVCGRVILCSYCHLTVSQARNYYQAIPQIPQAFLSTSSP
jgi:hypothetical protein